jgi:motility quorum-sensing regulator/GCU-specific mRNA interferase toxin
MGFNFEDMQAVILSLESGDLYKSMTTHSDHTVWQDVYHFPSKAGDVYLKLSIVGDVLIVSFKEL